MSTKTQGTRVQVGTATSSAKTITAITAANPPVVSSTAHGLANGTIVKLAGIVGMTELNGKVAVVRNQQGGTFELGGIDATGYTAYVSGGTATPQTMTDVAEVTDIDLFDGQAAEIDSTHLRSTAKEKKMGLPDFGGGQLQLMRVTDTGQAKLKSLKAAQTAGVFGVTTPDGLIAAFNAFVRSFSAQINRDSIVTGQVRLTFENEPSDFV